MLAEIILLTQLNTNLIAEYNMESNLPQLRNLDNAYPSGLEYKDESHVKMGPASIDDPILLIVDPIFDKDMNYIKPGYYHLYLEPGREFMCLIESGKVVATFPVVKVEIDKEKDAKKRKEQMPKGFFKQRKFLIKKYFKDRRRKQNIKKKRIEPETKVYSDATIEIVPSGKYFLIKYEKEAVKAWGKLIYH